MTDSYDYDAFGILTHQTSSTPNLYLYSGEQFDPDLGLYDQRARYLNASLGRFLTTDSFEGIQEDPSSIHKYLYAGSNPVDKIDPDGRMSLTEQVIVAALVGALASIGAFAYFNDRARRYLPRNAFQSSPDAVVLGFQTSVPLGRIVRKIASPVAVGLSLGLILASGLLGGKILIPLHKASSWWLFAYEGLGVGVGPALGGTTLSGYVGLAWNVDAPEDYKGPFFSRTATIQTLFAPGLSAHR